MQFLLILQYPVTAHLAFLSGLLWLKLAALFLVVVGVQWDSLRAMQTSAIAITVVLGIALGVIAATGWINTILLVLPGVIPLALLCVFGATLMKGAEPLVTAIGEQSRGPLSPTMRRYTRTITWLWTSLFAALTIEATLAALYADLTLWSWVINIGNPIAITCLFVGEFLYRKHRFPDHDHPSFAEYFDIVRKARRQ